MRQNLIRLGGLALAIAFMSVSANASPPVNSNLAVTAIAIDTSPPALLADKRAVNEEAVLLTMEIDSSAQMAALVDNVAAKTASVNMASASVEKGQVAGAAFL